MVWRTPVSRPHIELGSGLSMKYYSRYREEIHQREMVSWARALPTCPRWHKCKECFGTRTAMSEMQQI